MDVRTDVSLVSASHASGARYFLKRFTNSAAICCASAADTPLPANITLPPARRQPIIRAAAF